MGLISCTKRKIADFALKNATFPIKCKTGNELDWILKDNCPYCIANPIEPLSNAEYHRKYPAKNKMRFGVTTVYLCDFHLRKLKKELNNREDI